jgi:DNA-3-methyladenine glycosylase
MAHEAASEERRRVAGGKQVEGSSFLGDSRVCAEEGFLCAEQGFLNARTRESLAVDFYARPVLEVARDLIGCVVDHEGLSGVIVETEAYHESEPACHAFIGVTPRTRVLFGEPGTAYVYRSYGIHALLNAVCEPEGVGAAVLIRALEPLVGVEEMRGRRARTREHDLCSGPGKLTQALGVELSQNGTSLVCGPVTIRPRNDALAGCDALVGCDALAESEPVGAPLVIASPRIGISKAVELPWRFSLAGNPHVSRPRPPVPVLANR